MWVTRPQFYLDGEGKDRADLDPERGYTPEGWWTCDPATREGDLALIYRSQVAKDIGYLVAVRSDAERFEDASSEFDGWPVCRFQVLARFERPVKIDEMRADGVLAGWPALRASFVRRAFPVPDAVWDRLLERLGTDADQLRAALITGERRFRLERDLQKWLLGSGAQAFLDVGWDMDLIRSEYPCGHGRADLVYQQGKGVLGRRVVVELKRDTIGPSAIAQVRGYRDHLDQELPIGRRRTMAMVVGESLDRSAELEVAADSRLTFVSIRELQHGRGQ